MQQNLTNQQWQTFEGQGYVRLGPVGSDEDLYGLQQRIDEIMMGTAALPYERVMMQLDSTTGAYEDMPAQTMGHKGATLAYRKIQGLEFDPLFLKYMQKPLFRNICERVYGKGIPISCFRAMFMNKPANQGTHLPWHQDLFPHLNRPPEATVWMAMDPSTIEKGCVKVLPGSHHHFSHEDPTVFLDDGQITEALSQYTPVYLECKAGEGLLLHNRLLHTSEVNRTGQPRRAFSVCYMDGRAVSTGSQSFSVVFGEDALKLEETGTEMKSERREVS